MVVKKKTVHKEESFDKAQDKKALTVEDMVGNPADSTTNKKQLTADESEVRSQKLGVEETPVEEKPKEDLPTSENKSEKVNAPEETSPVGGQEQKRDLPRRNYNNGDQYYEQPVQTYPVSGILDIQQEGHGFLRPKFIPSQRDIYISQSQIRRFLLRPGDLIEGVGRPPKDTERYFGLLKVEKVNGVDADASLNRPYFDDLTPIYPKKQVVLATGKTPLSTRIMDLIAPIGFGQRGMIVSPPKAGKTTILKEIAAGISENFPDVHLMAALIGERPEEVTDISMSVKGDVVASNFDEPPENQTRVAEITLDRAKRLVEQGKDVVILLDSVTRLARAYNLCVAPSGRTLSGGFDPAALWPAKKFFGAARNCKDGGSLTIIGTALVETGSRMDDLIYEEFKGTGNMELHLDRKLADKRVYPSIDIEKSGTRQEELLIPEEKLKKVVTMRRMVYMLSDEERTALLIEKLSKTATNDEFLETLGKAA
jgi:transcription termination factor Rho